MQAGYKSDVWQVGVIFYLIVVGRLPFESPGHRRSENQVRREILPRPGDKPYEIRFPSYVPLSVAGMIGGMLIRDPEARSSLEVRLKPKYWKNVNGETLMKPYKRKPYN